MVAEYQCPGCINGPYVDFSAEQQECDAYRKFNGGCAGHRIGTQYGIGNYIALGMPAGFNKQQLPARGVEERCGAGPKRSPHFDTHFYPSREAFAQDMPLSRLNMPTWHKQEGEDFLLKVFHARIGSVTICVVRGGDKSLIPPEFTVFDVAEFEDEID